MNNIFSTAIINNVIMETDQQIINIEPFKCDGLILTPLDGKREIKIKPRSLITIDLIYNNKKWFDRDNQDWTDIIITPKTEKTNGRIYRCYPNETFTKFLVGDFRYDKKKPNPNIIVDNIITIIKYNWLNDVNLSLTNYYYNQRNKIMSKSLINMINYQNTILSDYITLLNPNINSNWLDLGCGHGKLIPIIKKYNPKQYLGIDIDITQLIRGINQYDENQNNIKFNPCDLANNWTNTVNKWYSIDFNIKYDYVVANFSLMHFCTDDFWIELEKITCSNTKFLFNIVCPESINDNSWIESNSFLNIDYTTKQTIYKFEWTHTEEKTERFISYEEINNIINKYGWKIIHKENPTTKFKLINFYKWFIIEKF
jgi:ubiquinone/menaquinone biosynthesis C-methylase UbiE